MSCKPHSTHHFACDCRERTFNEIESERDTLRLRVTELERLLASRTDQVAYLEKLLEDSK